MDAGIVYFANGNHIDGSRSWHFKQDTIYCVAPILGANDKPETQTYDFWAVGKDCCVTGSSDFRCGQQQAGIRSAIRSLDEDSLKFYRLAVQQAESLYDIVSTRPVFFEWAADPLVVIAEWKLDSFHLFLFYVAAFFVFNLGALAIS